MENIPSKNDIINSANDRLNAAKEIALELAEAGEFREALVSIASFYAKEPISDDRKHFMIGSAFALRNEPELDKKRVIDWINGIYSTPNLHGQRTTEPQRGKKPPETAPGKIAPVKLQNLRGIDGIKFRIKERIGGLLFAGAIGGVAAYATGLGAQETYRHFSGYNPAEVTATENTEDADADKENGGTEKTQEPAKAEASENKIPPKKTRHKPVISLTDDTDENGDDGEAADSESGSDTDSEENLMDRFSNGENQAVHAKRMKGMGDSMLKKLEETEKLIGNLDPTKIKGKIAEVKKGITDTLKEGYAAIEDAKKEYQNFKNMILGGLDFIALWGVFLYSIGKYFRLAKALIDIKKKILNHPDQAVVEGLEETTNKLNAVIEKVNKLSSNPPATREAAREAMMEVIYDTEDIK